MFMSVTIPGPTRQSFTESHGARTGLRNLASIVCPEPVDGKSRDQGTLPVFPVFSPVPVPQSQAYCQYSQYLASASTLQSSISQCSQVCCQYSQYLASTSKLGVKSTASISSISRVPVPQRQAYCKYFQYPASAKVLHFVFKRDTPTKTDGPNGLPANKTKVLRGYT